MVNRQAAPADTPTVDWLDFYDGAISTEQVRVGLAVAATAVAIAAVSLAVLLVPHGAPVRWAEAGWGVVAIGAAASYIAVQYRAAGRRQTMALRPATVLVMVLACDVAIAMLNIAGDGTSSLFLPLFAEVPVFVAMIGNPTMRRIDLAATIGALAATIVVVAPRRGVDPWAQILVSSAVLVILDRMVSLVMVSVRGRNQARGAVNHLMSLAAEAEDLDGGFAACLPLVDSILPAHSAAVVLRRAAGDRPQIVAAWSAPDADAQDPAPTDAAVTTWQARLAALDREPVLARALEATATTVADRFCAMPIGYGPDGELLLVVERRLGNGYASRFVHEAADALATCFLRLTGRLGHLDRLRQASLTDPLTGLPNRRHLLDRLEMELERSARTGTPVAVAMLDLDRFKQFNDSFGHLAGDQLLRTVARAITSRLRSQDLAARYGGDEICLVLPATDTAGAAQVVEAVRQHVGEAARRLGPTSGITVSAGVAVSVGDDAADAVLARADEHLLRAKRRGRDTVDVAPETPSPAPTTSH